MIFAVLVLVASHDTTQCEEKQSIKSTLLNNGRNHRLYYFGISEMTILQNASQSQVIKPGVKAKIEESSSTGHAGKVKQMKKRSDEQRQNSKCINYSLNILKSNVHDIQFDSLTFIHHPINFLLNTEKSVFTADMNLDLNNKPLLSIASPPHLSPSVCFSCLFQSQDYCKKNVFYYIYLKLTLLFFQAADV